MATTKNPLQAHREIYKKHLKAQEEYAATGLALEDSRKAVVEFLAERLADVEGVADRLKPEEQETVVGNKATGIILDANDDPLDDFVRAAESRFLKKLGKEKENPPLAIFHTNSMAGEGICPHCGETIEHGVIDAPVGTFGRGSVPG